jgi:hypothetical protein
MGTSSKPPGDEIAELHKYTAGARFYPRPASRSSLPRRLAGIRRLWLATLSLIKRSTNPERTAAPQTPAVPRRVLSPGTRQGCADLDAGPSRRSASSAASQSAASRSWPWTSPSRSLPASHVCAASPCRVPVASCSLPPRTHCTSCADASKASRQQPVWRWPISTSRSSPRQPSGSLIITAPISLRMKRTSPDLIRILQEADVRMSRLGRAQTGPPHLAFATHLRK